MPSTFTTRYGFEKPPIGITTGWGASHNTDLDSMDALFGTLEDGLADVVVDLGNKSDVGHTHTQSQITNLVSDLAAINSSLSGKSDTGHSHVESDVTGLVSDLAAINSSLALKAPSASPALTGNPTAPTQSPGNNSTRIATTAYADAAVAALVNSSPAALDTLAELATALGNDANFASTVTTALAGKQATSEKDQNSGYAGLTSGGLLKTAQFPTPTTSTFGGVKDLAAVANKFLTSIVDGVPVAAQPSAGNISGLAAIASSGKWSDLQDPSAALTLSLAGNASTFNHTSAVEWKWANTTAATSGTPQNTPSQSLSGTYWNGSASAEDKWNWQAVNGAGTNGTSDLTLTHTGSTGRISVVLPAGPLNWSGNGPTAFGNTAGGLARAASLSNGALALYTSNANQTILNLFQAGVNVHSFTGGAATGGSQNFGYTQTSVANAAQCIRGLLTEQLTLNTGGLTTDTTNNLLPAGAIIDAVVCRITTTITTTTNWAVGDSTTANRFSSANATLASGTTSIGLNQHDPSVAAAAGPIQAAAAKVRITCTGSNPGAGVIRITVFYTQFVAPTS